MEIRQFLLLYMAMKQMNSRFTRFFTVSSLLVVFLLSGCRTYGGYDSEEATFGQIAESNTVFANDLDKARGELQKLEQAAQGNSTLSPYVADYEKLLEKHSHMVEEHAKLASELDVKTGFLGQLTPSYRNLNRALGYIAAEQAAMKGHYHQLAAHIEGSSYAEGDIWESNISRSRYQAVPPYYQAISHALVRKSVTAVLSQSM